MKPGFYFDNSIPDYPRAYYLSGTKKGNKWIALDWPEPEWMALTWMCIPKQFELVKMAFSRENPTQFETK